MEISIPFIYHALVRDENNNPPQKVICLQAETTINILEMTGSQCPVAATFNEEELRWNGKDFYVPNRDYSQNSKGDAITTSSFVEYVTTPSLANMSDLLNDHNIVNKRTALYPFDVSITPNAGVKHIDKVNATKEMLSDGHCPRRENLKSTTSIVSDSLAETQQQRDNCSKDIALIDGALYRKYREPVYVINVSLDEEQEPRIEIKLGLNKGVNPYVSRHRARYQFNILNYETAQKSAVGIAHVHGIHIEEPPSITDREKATILIPDAFKFDPYE